MKKGGFTLIELLVVIAIIAVLAGLLMPVLASVRQSGNQAREIHAGRELATAYASAATDQDGVLMIGYASSSEAFDDLGRTVPNPVCNRYPWRLAKYLGYRVVGTLLVNAQAKIADLRAQQETYNYMVSLAPTFGMNCIMIGGDYHAVMAPTTLAIKRFGNFCATRMSQVQTPSRMILFASAHFISGNDTYYGYHTVEPPKLTANNWQDSYVETVPQSLGYVHLRYGGKAVAVMVDGHVELLDEKQLRDMRRWSIQASEENNENYLLGKN